ncbi:hypothetical protein AB0K14_19765 [Actinosynnema sp. NPDC050801]|uniref:hypothetical protein n=1 Tax=unclassified Actinosynnema TaxID=2637065 RepID=UPI0033D855A0
MSRVVRWSAVGFAVVVATAWIVLAQPASVAGQARPWSGGVAPAEVAAAFERCVEQAGTDEAFTMGPAHLRDDGRLVIGAVSDDTLLECGVGERGITVVTAEADDHSGRKVPFGGLSLTGYEGRPGATVVGYAGDDVAAVNFRTPDGRVIPARVRNGVFVFELPGTPEYDYQDLTHEAFDATGAVIPGR